MIRFNFMFLLFIAVLNIACSKSGKVLKTIPDSYIVSFGDSISYKAAKICYDEFTTHIDKKLVSLKKLKEIKNDINKQTIILNLDSALSSDGNVAINTDENSVNLYGKDSKSLIWVFVQYLKKQGEIDKRINTKSIPPPIVPFESIQNFDFAFQYREPFFQPNLLVENNRILSTNNLEEDWGIWGHNLGKLLAKKPKEDYFSKINGKINSDQICFSSLKTYQFLENYILDNFGYGNNDYSVNFTIVPNDNTLVCMCDDCQKQGNTKSNASPSVLAFIKHIAEKYPHHNFFTIDYLTVKNTSNERLPKNVGVFVSAIDVPFKLNFVNNTNTINFETKVNDWKKSVENVYVWDYVSNFDDYLTPFPNLNVSKERFKFYKKIGIKGVFCNGSGYDYTTFQDLKTYILSALLINPEVDIKWLTTKFYEQYYPKFGSKIASYVNATENNLIQNNTSLNIYGGIGGALKSYLNESDFISFYSFLQSAIENRNDDESKCIKKMLSALTFTCLQIGAVNGSKKNGYIHFNNSQAKIATDFLVFLNYLEENYLLDKIENFKESQGNLKKYLSETKAILLDSKDIKNDQLLFKKIEVLSRLDEDYQKIEMLTDGLKGIPSDYHTNWMFFTSDDLIFKLPEILPKGKYGLQISFLCNKKLKLGTPLKIEIFVGNKMIAVENFQNSPLEKERLTTQINFESYSSDKINVRVTSNNEFKKMACDEIVLRKI
jgi:hypothetical protein